MSRLPAVLALLITCPCLLVAQRAVRPTAPLAGEVIPVLRGGQPAELAAPAGIRLTRAGAVLFADVKPVLLARVAGAGGEMQQIARAGAGPGEFRSAPHFTGFRGDSIAAWDAGLRRWSILSPSGEFVRVLATGPESEPFATSAAWVADGAVVFNQSLDEPPLAEALVRAIVADASSEGPLVIHRARSGDLWTAPRLAASEWTVYDAAGRRRAVHRFARPFRLAHVADTVAVGEMPDADDVPQLVLVRQPAAAGSASKPAVRPASSAAAESPDTPRQLSELLRSMVMLQEGAYADSGQYVTSTRALRLELPPGVEVHVLEAGKQGWFAIARHRAQGVTCAGGVGFGMIGWSEAKAYCSR